jgi:IS1 family transposase
MCTIGLKKTTQITDANFHILELDELYWFIGQKPRTQTRENVYVITMASRLPRQIAGFDVAFDKSPERVQRIVDDAPEAKKYCTDGWSGYVDVVYPGEHIRNARDKSDTFTVEGVNADLRHYIPILARRSRCFARKLETLRAVMEVFVEAYNQFGVAKYKYRQTRQTGEIPFAVIDFL